MRYDGELAWAEYVNRHKEFRNKNLSENERKSLINQEHKTLRLCENKLVILSDGSRKEMTMSGRFLFAAMRSLFVVNGKFVSQKPFHTSVDFKVSSYADIKDALPWPSKLQGLLVALKCSLFEPTVSVNVNAKNVCGLIFVVSCFR